MIYFKNIHTGRLCLLAIRSHSEFVTSSYDNYLYQVHQNYQHGLNNLSTRKRKYPKFTREYEKLVTAKYGKAFFGLMESFSIEQTNDESEDFGFDLNDYDTDIYSLIWIDE